jgi:3-hydroxyisobutyrate dehydrogenase-like beta-hydroxyacid dehydrogenase
MAQATAQIGVTGLGVMGRNLARNFARHGYTVALHNRTTSRTTAMVDQFGHEGNFVPAQTAEEFVQALERPRRLVIMVNAGPATDAVIDEFAPLLEDGDMIIDGGNAHFHDTRRREAAEMIQADHIHVDQRRAYAVDVPLVAALAKSLPVIGGIAPEASQRIEAIRRGARHHARPAVFIQQKIFGPGPHIAGVRRHEER